MSLESLAKASMVLVDGDVIEIEKEVKEALSAVR